MFLIAFAGRFSARRPGPPRFLTRFVLPPAGLDAWRLARDVEPGPLSIILGNRALFDIAQRSEDVRRQLDSWVSFNAETGAPPEATTNEQGQFKWIVGVGERARFLTSEGVIDPAHVSPGDLSRSMCAPWQYDFADCGCFYWASNKPDLVSSEHQPSQILNFQRKDRSPASDAAARPDDWVIKYRGSWDNRALTMRHAEMIQRWTELPFVIDGRETGAWSPSPVTAPRRPLSRAEIIDRMRRLAPVEHALSVEYLYAHYSLRAKGRPD
ncbi:MAG: LodA/GoxA family CTQ-dependent oxidase, partial [Methylocella sp.]